MKADAVSQFSHVRPTDTAFKCEGLRDFFLYRDLGIAEATGGRLLVQLVKANRAPEKGTGWHIHEAEFHVVYMIKGWARFMYEDKELLSPQATACISAPAFATTCSITLLTWSS